MSAAKRRLEADEAEREAKRQALTLADLRFFSDEVEKHIIQLAKMMNDCEALGIDVNFNVNKVGTMFIPDVKIKYNLRV